MWAMRRSPFVWAAVPALLLFLLVSPSPAPASPPDRAATASAVARAVPGLSVYTMVRGLNHPWDVRRMPDGRLLLTERNPARLSIVDQQRRRTTVRFPTARIWQSGETGLLGLAVDPAFRDNRRFYTCSGWEKQGGGHDIRIIAWRLVDGQARSGQVLLDGFPTTSGRHGGCRLLITSGGALMAGSGDAAVGTNPRNKRSLGGKTLRLNRFTGAPSPYNPYAQATSRNQRYVFTFGHRNVQGLAERRNGTVWSVEHGTGRDDEVNLLRGGGDYGWHPVPGYNESVPMTDQSLPGPQVNARWRSGEPTLATSGASWVYGSAWGSLNGALAVACLKAERLVFMRFSADGALRSTYTPAVLRRFGRLRTATLLPNGDLLVLSDQFGDEGGRLLRVVAR